MAYATQADLLNALTARELVQLTDDERVGKINVAVVASALNDASAFVDSYCRSRYATPLQMPCDDATRITRDVAVYKLYARRPTQKVPEPVRDVYMDAVAFLKDIASGKASLDQQSGAPAQVTSNGGVLPTRNDERFTDRNLEGYY